MTGSGMNQRLLELREARGRLRSRCQAQRLQLAEHTQGLQTLCAAADQVRAGTDWLRQNPIPVGAAVVFLMLLRPSRAWRWGKRALWVWQGWRALRKRLLALFPA